MEWQQQCKRLDEKSIIINRHLLRKQARADSNTTPATKMDSFLSNR